MNMRTGLLVEQPRVLQILLIFKNLVIIDAKQGE